MFTLKIPGDEWLNLALVRRLQIDTGNKVAPQRRLCLITWENKDKDIFYDEQAIAIIQSFAEIKRIDKSDAALPPDELGSTP